MLIQDNTRKYQDRLDVCTAGASRFLKWREDDEQGLLKTASEGLLKGKDIFGM